MPWMFIVVALCETVVTSHLFSPDSPDTLLTSHTERKQTGKKLFFLFFLCQKWTTLWNCVGPTPHPFLSRCDHCRSVWMNLRGCNQRRYEFFVSLGNFIPRTSKMNASIECSRIEAFCQKEFFLPIGQFPRRNLYLDGIYDGNEPKQLTLRPRMQLFGKRSNCSVRTVTVTVSIHRSIVTVQVAHCACWGETLTVISAVREFSADKWPHR